MKHKSDYDRTRWLSVRNTTDDTVPPFSLVEPFGVDADGTIQVRQAQTIGCQALVTGQQAIQPNACGLASWGDAPVNVVWDASLTWQGQPVDFVEGVVAYPGSWRAGPLASTAGYVTYPVYSLICTFDWLAPVVNPLPGGDIDQLMLLQIRRTMDFIPSAYPIE